jgi:ABC-type Na+ efflux pump permease subunit
VRKDLVFAVVNKDFSEFKRNKYVLYTLVTFPIIFSIVMPISLLGSILFSPGLVLIDVEPGDPLVLDTYGTLNQSDILELKKDLSPNETLMLQRVNVTRAYLAYSVLNNSKIDNSTLDYVIVNHCVLYNVTILHGQVYHSYIADSELRSGEITDAWGHNVTVTEFVTVTNTKIQDLKNPNAFSVKEVVGLLSSTILMMFVLIPTATPTIISSFSIIGEKKAKSLEPILATPISDMELLTGKVLASFIPTFITTVGSFFIFALLMQVMSVPILKFNIAFTPIMLAGVFFLGPAVCILSIVANVFISSKVNDIRAAQQLGSLVVLPLIFMFMLPITGVALLGPEFVVIMALLIIAMDGAILWFTVKVFNRENILVNWS